MSIDRFQNNDFFIFVLHTLDFVLIPRQIMQKFRFHLVFMVRAVV
jgi:hypothetical protein